MQREEQSGGGGMIRNKMAEMKTEKTERNRNGGFTIVETLVVASIIVVFLAFGMVGILRYRDYLRITELDNMARSIYVAAQNRAVLLDNDRRFQTLVGECTKVTLSDSGKERWYIDSGDLAKKSVLDDLLPMGTIDPALRNGRFYIVYEPASASVTDVFYVEKPDYDLKTFKSGIVDALNEMGADDKRENRMTNKPVMVGWFGSNGAAGRDKTLPGPSVDVLIENGNELTLTVKYTMPADLPVDANVTCWANVTLKYGNKEVKLLEMIPSGDTVAVSSPFFERLTDDTKNNNITAANHAAESCTYTWVLDSLADHVKSDDTKVPRQFKGIDSSFNPGGDFTVTASLKLTADGYQDSIEVKAEDTDNSLFAADTHDDDTAYIANLRHL